MPIYAYKCTECGHQKEVLQKISDAPLTDCPHCGQPSMVKMVTAAGFQLKGSGWYATDFRNKDAGSKNGKTDTTTDGKTESKTGSANDAKADNAVTPGPKAAAGTPGCGAGGCGSCS